MNDEFALSMSKIHPISKDELMREIYIIGLLDDTYAVEKFRVIVPKQGHKQFKNQLAARTAFASHEKRRKENGARYTYTIYSKLIGFDLDEFSAPMLGMPEFYKAVGHYSASRKYAVDSMALRMEDDEALRASVIEKCENSLRAKSCGDDAPSSDSSPAEGARP